MNFILNIANIAFSKKVDTSIRRLLESNKLKVIPIIIVFSTPVDDIIQSRARRLGLNIKYVLPFMNALCGFFPVRNLESLVGVLEVKKIYHDGIAFLMEMPGIDISKKALEINYQKSYLSGKGVTIAFIDSGIYPHPDLIKPRNKIYAFNDFVNNIQYPYDDNGHGTACAGIAAGASIDGKFMSPAYESQIVCAKAFNKSSWGFFSDILASMQWIIDIKDKYNIRLMVLPFGTNEYDKNFDILGLACEKVHEKNILIITCTGNFGPNECSITSPGNSPHTFTAGGLEITAGAVKPLPLSGRGPTINNVEKPDCIMPAKNIAALNSDINFVPSNNRSYTSNTLPILYTNITGTSAAASLAASAAALLYQKLPELTPDTAKSILKKCCISVNLLKTAQGSGIISVKNIEEIPSPEQK